MMLVNERIIILPYKSNNLVQLLAYACVEHEIGEISGLYDIAIASVVVAVVVAAAADVDVEG
jgi:hypothetical protein